MLIAVREASVYRLGHIPRAIAHQIDSSEPLLLSQRKMAKKDLRSHARSKTNKFFTGVAWLLL